MHISSRISSHGNSISSGSDFSARDAGMRARGRAGVPVCRWGGGGAGGAGTDMVVAAPATALAAEGTAAVVEAPAATRAARTEAAAAATVTAQAAMEAAEATR